jgi:hypothetical protein
MEDAWQERGHYRSLAAKQLVASSLMRENGNHNPQSAEYTTARSRKRRNKQPKRKSLLFAEAESLNHGFVALGIVFFEVVEQATPLADQHEKATARAMIFQVRFEVVRQLTNAFAQQSDLDFWTARIGGVRSVLINDRFLLLSG